MVSLVPTFLFCRACPPNVVSIEYVTVFNLAECADQISPYGRIHVVEGGPGGK